MMYKIIKRILDIILSFILIILSLPLIIIILILIRIDTKGNPIFLHERIGKNGKKIKVIKFRTMINNADNYFEDLPKEQKEEYYKNYKIRNDARVTKIGGFLRKYFIDEFPQIFNVFIGNMSFIGPRPVTYEETLKYKKNRDKFLSVKPGITGYWQINNYLGMTYEERIKYELYYVDNFSFKLDLKIFFKTFSKIFKKEKTNK